MRFHTIAAALQVALFASCPCWSDETPVDEQIRDPEEKAVSTGAPAPPALKSTTFSASAVRLRGIDFGAIFDGFYSYNGNHPVSNVNQLYNFSDHTDEVDLNMLKLTVSRDPAPVGFRVDAGFGRAFELIHTPTPEPAGFRFLEQAYVSLKPASWKGLEVDLGEFVTAAGSEVIETKDNWNYSRSYLFALGPYQHFGVRALMPVRSDLTLGVQVVNGWNSIVDPYGNNMQTVGLTQTLVKKKFTWSNNYYVGNQSTPTYKGNCNYFDTALLLTPTTKLSAYLNIDYGQQRISGVGVDRWWGIAGAARWQLTQRFALSPRLEYFDDRDGFTTGTRQSLHEVTFTAEYKILDGVLARAEFRRDDSSVPYFDRGPTRASAHSLSTATIGLIAFFPVKR